MGFDPCKVPMHKPLPNDPNFDFDIRRLDDIEILSAALERAKCLGNESSLFLVSKPQASLLSHLEIQK